MKLQEIKSQLEISTFELNTANDIDNNPTEWMRHWDNNRRIAVSIHKELVAELQKNSEISSLGLQHEERTGEKGKYDSYRIVKYAPSEVQL